MIDILRNVGRRGAVAKCTQCFSKYSVKDRYSAKKSTIGHLCTSCKNLMVNLELTQDYLQKVFYYNPETGILSHSMDSSSGKKGDIIGTLHSGGYLECSLGDKPYLVHRLIWTYMTGEIPEQVDHLNHNRQDNRWVNLRNVNNTENSKNTQIGKNNKSGVLGVSLHKPTGKYRAYINENHKQHHLGLFLTFEEAALARAKANADFQYHNNHGK